jgi:hypothetical protein
VALRALINSKLAIFAKKSEPVPMGMDDDKVLEKADIITYPPDEEDAKVSGVGASADADPNTDSDWDTVMSDPDADEEVDG